LVIAQSTSVERELVDQGFKPPIVPCFDGVPIPSEPFPVSSDIKGELLGTADTVLGGVGRLVDRKGFRYLIEAMPRVLERHSQVTVALVGDGPLRKELEDLAATLGIGKRVRFLGFRRDIRYVLQAFDIFVLPSLKEGLPLTMIEAMAEGRPTVASAVDGIPTFVHHERTGLLVPPKDPEKLADALIRLLDDRSLAAQYGRSGRALAAREGSVKKTAARVDELLLQVLEGSEIG
jgi:glycosyltransferase involved in cell wall biosynthesis